MALQQEPWVPLHLHKQLQLVLDNCQEAISSVWEEQWTLAWIMAF